MEGTAKPDTKSIMSGDRQKKGKKSTGSVRKERRGRKNFAPSEISSGTTERRGDGLRQELEKGRGTTQGVQPITGRNRTRTNEYEVKKGRGGAMPEVNTPC